MASESRRLDCRHPELTPDFQYCPTLIEWMRSRAASSIAGSATSSWSLTVTTMVRKG